MKSLFRLFGKSDPVPDAPAVQITSDLYAQLERELQNPGGLAYILKMVWLGRGDKFSIERAPFFDWATANFVRSDLAQNYTGFQRGVIHFQGENHEVLAHELVKSLRLAKDKLLVNDNPASTSFGM